jgi:hypothetical protein
MEPILSQPDIFDSCQVQTQREAFRGIHDVRPSGAPDQLRDGRTRSALPSMELVSVLGGECGSPVRDCVPAESGTLLTLGSLVEVLSVASKVGESRGTASPPAEQLWELGIILMVDSNLRRYKVRMTDGRIRKVAVEDARPLP